MPKEVNDQFTVIRYPSDSGAIIAKFDAPSGRLFPDDVADYSDFVIQSVSSRSALTEKSIDQSGLSADEKELLSQVYPVH